MPTLTEDRTDAKTTTARLAAGRARDLREQARALDSDALTPLRNALLARAGELELAAAVLGDDDPAPGRTPLRAIA